MEAEGGVADYTLTDANGEFVKQVKWKAPALNTVLLRYSRDEVRYILTYGRPFSPMPAWGVKGGGPMNDQQIQNLIDYLESIQLTPEGVAEAAHRASSREMRKEKNPDGTLKYPTSISDGELLFNLGYEDGFAGGAYSCGRCHTTGWSYHDKTVDGNGALGPPLRGGVTPRPVPRGHPRLRPTRSTSSAPAPSRASSTAATARAPAACRASAPCRPRSTTRSNTGEVGVNARERQRPRQGRRHV